MLLILSLSLSLRCFLAPNTGNGGLDLFFEAFDQFAVCGDQCLLGFDFGDDGLLGGEGWEGNWNTLNNRLVDLRHATGSTDGTPCDILADGCALQNGQKVMAPNLRFVGANTNH